MTKSFMLSQEKVLTPTRNTNLNCGRVLSLTVLGHVVRIVREHYLRQDISKEAAILAAMATERFVCKGVW